MRHGLDRHAVLRTENVKIKNRHDCGERSGGRLMAADLYFTGGTDVVGMVNHPGREPERAALQVLEK